MSRQRLWILACAVGCFAAGVSVGLALPGVVRAFSGAAVVLDPDERYVERFAADFGLTAEQRRKLGIVMQQFAIEEFEVFRRADRDELPDSLRSELAAARARQRERIRALLDDEQCRRFDDETRAAGSVR